MTSRQIVVERSEAFPRRAATWLADALAEVVRARGRCAMALSGGTTPRPVYAALATPDLAGGIEWSRVHVYFGDERAVPTDHVDSNFRMVNESLLAHVPVPAAHIHRMEAERPDLGAAAAAYDRLLPAALDILVLGMGADGHTASLFPGSWAVEERRRRVVAVEGPKPPARRLTITPPVITAARQVAVLATGKEKAAAVARALDDHTPATEVPASLARHGVWFLDPAAAAQLARVVT
ncbi:MAG TPA: 6-phosphogluconolactonase [Gemmatimonadales bacterium]|nr:6-phosphogluconolactonase [Gemmatimonadales bacterium]